MSGLVVTVKGESGGSLFPFTVQLTSEGSREELEVAGLPPLGELRPPPAEEKAKTWMEENERGLRKGRKEEGREADIVVLKHASSIFR